MPRRFEVQELRDTMAASGPSPTIHFHERLASTNEEIRNLVSRGAAPGTVVVADCQTAGRGRRGRQWHSPPGLGLYLSMLLRPSGPLKEVTRWTVAAAVAAATACRKASNVSVVIAWPNDILHEGRKLGGILTEMRSQADTAIDLVIGIGLNVHHGVADFPAELQDQATSLGLARGGAAPSREVLAAVLIRELEGMAEALDGGAWPQVARRWEGMAPAARGHRVTLPDGEGQGLTEGLDATGAMVVRRADGTTRSLRMVDELSPSRGA